MLDEVVDALHLKPSSIVVDATLGSGGHAQAILQHLGVGGKYIGIEWDPQQLERARVRLDPWLRRVVLVHDSYRHLDQILFTCGVSAVDGILIDFGLSMDQLVDSSTGMSFLKTGPLDMRFDRSRPSQTAADLLNNVSAEELEHILTQYGDVPAARALTRYIIQERQARRFETTEHLLRAIEKVPSLRRRRHHPATQVFQALRIATNHEFEAIREVLPKALESLKSAGRLVTLTYHSGEDRIVKAFIHEMTTDCICPPSLPVCRCDHRAQARTIRIPSKHPSEEEIRRNPASRSAQLRVIEKI